MELVLGPRRSLWRVALSTFSRGPIWLTAIFVFLVVPCFDSMARGQDPTSTEEAPPIESPAGLDPEEKKNSKSAETEILSEEGEEEKEGDDSESITDEERSSEGLEADPVTDVTILITGSGEESPPIRGAEVFVSIKNHDDIQTSTNAKGHAKLSIPSGRVKIQVTAKEWKTFGEFYDLKGDHEVITISLESRKPGGQ